jgi:hypothetical protein
MAKFVCQACKHEQPTGNESVGKSVHCPVCGAVGKVVPEKVEPAKAAESMVAPKIGSNWQRDSANVAGHLKIAILLLGTLVTLQVMELLGVNAERGVSGPLEVEVVNTELPVTLSDHGAFFGPLPVEIQNSLVPVDIQNSAVPVDIQNSEVDVKLNNHYIISSDPIPVEIVR